MTTDSAFVEVLPRILLLDISLEVLTFIEQMLQDSGLSAISSTNAIEAISLVATGFFDILIVVDRRGKSHAAAVLSAMASGKIHCQSCYCWSIEEIRCRCADLIEETLSRKRDALDPGAVTPTSTSPWN